MMKQPAICPSCGQIVTMPSDKRFLATVCDSCSTALWVVTHDENSYLFDKGDELLFRHFAGKFRAETRARCAANGWVEVVDSKRGQEMFEQFVEHRKFSTQKTNPIDIPQPAVVIDFSNIDCNFPIPTTEQIAVEKKLRQQAIECFVGCSGTDLCVAIDVNHCQYTFIPGEVDWSIENAWPIPFTPFSEYLGFNTRCYSQGIYVDPGTRHLTAYGEAFADRFAVAFSNRQVS